MKRSLILALVCAVLLSSCSLFSDGEAEEPEGGIPSPTPPAPTSPVVTLAPRPIGDGRFSLRYNADATLNPITGTDAANMALSSLMYEGLFVILEDFTRENVLCESFETEDNITWDFTLRDDILMSDGTDLTAYDVVYSLNQARQSGRFRSRLTNIESASVAGALVVRVRLGSADSGLPMLLDIPVIKDGSSGTAPRGCGAYKYQNENGTVSLITNEYYRHADTLPVSEIYLVSCAETELGEFFTEGIIDLFADDPNAVTAPVRRDHEVRYYNTPVLQYIGFRGRTSAVGDARFRSVVQLAVDRGAIVREALGGRAIVSPLALPPFYAYYDTTREPEARHDTLVAMSDALAEIGMADYNSDTYLEYLSTSGYIPFSLTFIVNEENAARVRSAQMISGTLRSVGINVALQELPFDEYMAALESGEFDMYLGETRLPVTFELSELITPGGSLDYGGMGTSELAALTERLRSAGSDFARRNAAGDLCRALVSELPIIPIAYKQHAVHSGRGELRGIKPSQTGLFWNIYEWTIDVK